MTYVVNSETMCELDRFPIVAFCHVNLEDRECSAGKCGCLEVLNQAGASRDLVVLPGTGQAPAQLISDRRRPRTWCFECVVKLTPELL
jgi:hypothetical protein